MLLSQQAHQDKGFTNTLIRFQNLPYDQKLYLWQ